MRILLFESNLLWSSKLKMGIHSLGHEAVLKKKMDGDEKSGDLAVVNLSQALPDPTELIASLHLAGVKVIAHAGHKEKDLLTLGRSAGADLLVTNGELSAKLQDVLARATQ